MVLSWFLKARKTACAPLIVLSCDDLVEEIMKDENTVLFFSENDTNDALINWISKPIFLPRPQINHDQIFVFEGR